MMKKHIIATSVSALIMTAAMSAAHATDTYVHVINDSASNGHYEKSPDLQLFHMAHFDNATPANLDVAKTNQLVQTKLKNGEFGQFARRYNPSNSEEEARYWIIKTTDKAIDASSVKVQIGFDSAVASGGNFRVELIDETGNGSSSYHVNCSQGQSGSHCGWHDNDKVVEIVLSPNNDRFNVMRISGDSGSFNNPTYQVLDVNCLSVEIDSNVSQIIPVTLNQQRCSD